jgi:NAD(P)-dependent dehydrogenase (short-subunit alcohol dehydrogenase family)
MNKSADNLLLLAAAGAGAYLAYRAWKGWARHYDLRGRTVLITGASRGLGLVLAREALAEGARLAICSRNAEDLDRARDELVRRGPVIAVPCDITDRGQVAEMVRDVESRLGPVDVLINNAGVIQVGPVEVMTLEDYEEAMRTHYWGPLYTILAVLPGMRRRGHGRIVNVTSIGGKVAFPHLVPYDASKVALVGLSEGLRAELIKDGVYVTTVVPGLMRTGSPPNATFKGQHRLEYAWFAIGDALPFSSISAESAARQILAACKAGTAEITISLPAKLAVLFHGVLPGMTADMLGLVNRLLPGPGGIGTRRAFGKESGSALAPSPLTALSDWASAQNREVGAATGTPRVPHHGR